MRLPWKKIGGIAKLAWNLLLAGKTVVIKGQPITLPPLEDQSANGAEPVHLHDLLEKP